VIEKGGTDDGGRVRWRGDEVGYELGCEKEKEGVFLFVFVLFSKSFQNNWVEKGVLRKGKFET